MKSLFLLLISMLVIASNTFGKATKTILCNPEFKFEYNSSAFKVRSYTNSTLLTDEKFRNELHVTCKGKYYGSMTIKTGLAYDRDLFPDKESFKRHQYNDYVSYRQPYYPTTDYEVSKEFITVNGLTFTLKRFLVESCGMEGKSSSYYYSLDLDTTLRNFSRLQVQFISYNVEESYLPAAKKYALDLTTFFQGFGIVPTSEILKDKPPATTAQIQLRYESEVKNVIAAFRRRLIKSYHRDTTCTMAHKQSAGIIALETLRNYAKSDRLDLLADTIIAIRHQFANRDLKLFTETYDQYIYSEERRYHFLELLSRNQFPYDYFLNVRVDGGSENDLDTLFKLTQLHYSDIDEVMNFWHSWPAGVYYTDFIEPLDTNNHQLSLLSNRPYAHFVPELIRKIYTEDLKSTNPNFQPYLELINSADIKSYLLFNPSRYHQSELLLATFRNNDAHWKLEIDTLDTSMRLRGRERLREYGDYSIFEQRDSVYLLDCRTSPVTMTPLPFTGDSLDQFTFYSKEIAFNKNGGFIEPTNCNFQRDKVDEAIIDRMWNQLVRDKKIIVDNEYNPCYTCINLNHGDSLVPPLSYYTYSRLSVSAEQACYRSGYIIRDLDADGSDELFCYTVNNGALKDWTCYWLKERRITYMEPARAKALIEQDGDCINLKAFSKIGRKSKQASTNP